jgi:hypothetical protein
VFQTAPSQVRSSRFSNEINGPRLIEPPVAKLISEPSSFKGTMERGQNHERILTIGLTVLKIGSVVRAKKKPDLRPASRAKT